MAQAIISITPWADFKKYWLIRRPKPEREPIISDTDWVKECIITYMYQVVLEGKQMEAYNELEIDIDIT